MTGLVVEVVTALATTAAVLVAAYQTLLTRRELRKRDVDAFEGVNLSWRAVERPDPSTGADQTWLIEFALANPGTLPIDRVVARATMGRPVRRLRHTGSLDPPTTEFEFRVAVLPGGGSTTWRRRVVAQRSDWPSVMDIHATVTFVDGEMKARQTRWPRGC